MISQSAEIPSARTSGSLIGDPFVFYGDFAYCISVRFAPFASILSHKCTLIHKDFRKILSLISIMN